MRLNAVLLFLLASTASSLALGIVDYFGTGCPHCARVDSVLAELQPEYGLEIQKKEIYYDAQNRQEMFDAYSRFGIDPGKSGVPTLLFDNRSLIIGEMDEARFRDIFDAHLENQSLSGVYTQDSFSEVRELDAASTLTIWVLLGAAAVDSVNPCTIAVMAMLLGVILSTHGRGRVLAAALTFIAVVFVSYFLMGLGLLRTITNAELTNIFFAFVTFAALALALLELRAYFSYSPGMLAMEIPMFLRPHMKGMISRATSVPGVAFAALICSLFLLPCSSGPYLLVLGMLAKSVTLKGLAYLFIYNLVFVLPMVFVSLMIYSGMATVAGVGEFREQHIRKLHLVAGLLMLALFLLMLDQMLGILSS